jgi:hypothetical protein
MAYTNGTTSDFSGVMTDLITFCTTHCGFTLEGSFSGTQNLSYNGTSTGTVYTIRCLSRGGVYWWFRYTNNNVFCLLSTGTGATWNTIANRSPNDTEVNVLTGSYAYRFFEVDDSVHVALTRTNSGIVTYRHLSFGKMQKHGTWTGGEYFAGSYDFLLNASTWNNKDEFLHTRIFGYKNAAVTSGDGSSGGTVASYGVMRCTYNGKNYANIDRSAAGIETGMNEAVTIGAFRDRAASGTTGIIHELSDSYSPNLWSDTAVASPPSFLLFDNAGASRFFDLGYLTGMRFLNIKNLTPGQLVNTDWRVYPLSFPSETGAATHAASGNYGVAFREVA